MNIIYRKINPDIFEEAYQFNLTHEFSFRDSSNLYIPDSEEERIKKTNRIIEQLNNKDEEKYLCLAAFEEDKMIGGIYQNKFTIDNQLACHVHGLWIHSDYRKRGIAKELKRLGEEWAKHQACKFMDSNVRVTNKSMIALNESLGYEVARFNFRKKI